jgi:hypothetical protein
MCFFWGGGYIDVSYDGFGFGFGLDVFLCCHFSYGYALEECRERSLAEDVARRALTINKTTPFATHAMGESYFPSILQ